MTISQPSSGDTGPSPGTRLEELSPGYMAIDNAANATAMQRFLIKFQYKPPPPSSTNAPDTTDAANAFHVRTTMTILSKLKLQHGQDINILTLNNDMIDLQAVTNQSYSEFSKFFKYVHRPNAQRPHEVWFTVETTQNFGNLKRPLIDWLKDNNFWMDLHGFGLQVLRTFKLGFLIAYEPRHIFRADLQSSINREIAFRLSRMSPTKRTAFYAQHGSPNTTADRPPPTIRILFASSIKHIHDTSPTPIETRGLRVDCDYDDKNVLDHLLMEISRAASYFGIFVSSTVTRNNNQLDHCRTILRAQNVTLQNHRIHAIAGISVPQMDQSVNNTTLRSQLLALPGVRRIERTSATPLMGKWLIFTDATNFAATQQAIDDNLKNIFAELQLSSAFRRFPEPTRLDNPEPPMEYINAVLEVANQALASSSDDTASCQAPNAWARGPPKVPTDQASTSGSTLAPSDAHTMTTQMSDLQTMLQTSQQQIQTLQDMHAKFTEATENQTASLDRKITSMIEQSFDSLMERFLPRIHTAIDSKLDKFFPHGATVPPAGFHPLPPPLPAIPPIPYPYQGPPHAHYPPTTALAPHIPMPSSQEQVSPNPPSPSPQRLTHSHPAQYPPNTNSLPPHAPAPAPRGRSPTSDTDAPQHKIPRQTETLDQTTTTAMSDAHGGIPVPKSPIQQ